MKSAIPSTVGIMTGGGDAPGLNGIIESVSRTLIRQGVRVLGIRDGFEGIFTRDAFEIQMEQITGIHAQSGTYLGTSNKSGLKGKEQLFRDSVQAMGLDGLIVAGGDGTFSGLSLLGEGLRFIGVPKTIDNDLSGTEITFGFDTACSVVSESLDALRFTAESHRRLLFVETMGRTAGWMALGGGLAAYADAILIPERPFSREAFLSFIRSKQKEGRRGLVIAVSEGSYAEGEAPTVAFTVKNSPQAERYGGVAQQLSRWTEAETGWESRHVVLGHLQRSKAPTTTDRFLTLAMGVEVSRMVLDSAWGQGVVYRNGRVQRAPIQDLMQPPRLVDRDHRWVKMAQALGIFI